MGFTWTGDPNNSIVEQIRFEISDIDASAPLFTDEEIEFAYEIENDNIYGASARLFEILSRRYAKDTDRKLGPLSVSSSQKSMRYLQLARDLRKKSISLVGVPYVGGVYKSEDAIMKANTNIKSKIFDIDLMDNK